MKKKKAVSGSRQVVGIELNEAVPALQEHTVWQADSYRTGDKWSTEAMRSQKEEIVLSTHNTYLMHFI